MRLKRLMVRYFTDREDYAPHPGPLPQGEGENPSGAGPSYQEGGNTAPGRPSPFRDTRGAAPGRPLSLQGEG